MGTRSPARARQTENLKLVKPPQGKSRPQNASPPLTPDEFKTTIIRGMKAGLDGLADDALGRIRKQIPEYQQVSDAAVLADIKTAVARNASIVLNALEESRRLQGDELTAMRANGARRCEQDLLLDSLIDAVRIGIQTGMDWAVEGAKSLPDPKGWATSVVSEIHQGFLNLFHDIATASREGYMESKAHRSAKLRERSELFQEVLAGTFRDEEKICAQAARLGYDLRSLNGLMLFAGANSDHEAFKKATRAFREAVPAAVEIPLAPHIGHQAVLVVPSVSEQTWPRAIAAAKDVIARHPFIALASTPVSGPGELRDSYRSAAEMAALALKVYGPNAFVQADDLLVFRTIQATDHQKLSSLVEETLGPVLALPGKTGAKLIETIEAMHRHPRTKAAKVLNVSLKTLNNRWKRISELTGLRLEAPADRLRLDLALYAVKALQK
jgi:PucR-like helix-turn-helix protein/diguanylate cyclase with GGDEF domain